MSPADRSLFPPLPLPWSSLLSPLCETREKRVLLLLGPAVSRTSRNAFAEKPSRGFRRIIPAGGVIKKAFCAPQWFRCSVPVPVSPRQPSHDDIMSLAADRRRKAKALEEAGAALSVKLVARSTRGKRISELEGEDAEADETFWGQGAWQEKEEDDSEFSSEEGKRCSERDI